MYKLCRALANLWLRIGVVDPRTAIIGLSENLLVNVLVANLPQVVLSLLYFSYNGLFTAMLMGYEWTTYGMKRKGLRVSHHPQGDQRSTYFLQLPYRFGTPLMVLSGTLHWLVSQSIFLISIDFYDETGKAYEGRSIKTNLKTLGYSPIAIVSVIVMATCMVVLIIAFGYIPYRQGMPLAGSCSMAISAACHPVDEDRPSQEKVQWGVVSASNDGIGHCSFSSKPVNTPVKGETYT